MLWTVWIAVGAVFGGVGVALGAFGAHALKGRLTPHMLSVFEIGIKYQMYHALALVLLGLLAIKVDNWMLKASGVSFAVGILLFSGSLYGLALSDNRSLGVVTPFGGVCFLIGWIMLGISVLRF